MDQLPELPPAFHTPRTASRAAASKSSVKRASRAGGKSAVQLPASSPGLPSTAARQAPPEPPDVVLVPIGGGGLVSGIGAVMKTYRPDTRVVGVQASNSPAMAEALIAGQLVTIAIYHTIADGLAANIELGSRTFPLAQEVVDEMVLITEEEMVAAIGESFTELHVALEGSAVVGIAALLGGKISDLEGKRVAAVVTGRNIATERLVSILKTET